MILYYIVLYYIMCYVEGCTLNKIYSFIHSFVGSFPKARLVLGEVVSECDSPASESGVGLFCRCVCWRFISRRLDVSRAVRLWVLSPGSFTNERSQASLRVLGKGCAFRHTTYSVEDHAPPEGGLGVPLNHPRFLEWISPPTSAWLLEMIPGQWCDTLSRDQAMTAAMQLYKDACLMNTNLDIIDQYALALHGRASKILQQTIGGNPYPKAEVAAAAQGPRARRASVHMEALGPMQFDTPYCKTSIRDVLNG